MLCIINTAWQHTLIVPKHCFVSGGEEDIFGKRRRWPSTNFVSNVAHRAPKQKNRFDVTFRFRPTARMVCNNLPGKSI